MTAMNNSKRVLVVDRNAAAASYVRDMLQYYGYEVELAPAWDAAMQALQKQPFDVVLFDETMVHRGLGTPLDWLRGEGYQMPVMIMSDIALTEMWGKCLDYGSVELIAKPVSPSTLKIMVDAVLKKGRIPKIVPVIRLSPPAAPPLDAAG